MRRIRIKTAYDGTDYCGWQLQPGLPTISDELYRAISELTGESRDEIHLIGASRTDSGVHALGNIAVFETNTRIPADRFAAAINQHLPADIRVITSGECAPDWHPRKNSAEKTYIYNIYHSKAENPLYRRFAAHCYYRLDLDRMKAAAAPLIGEHDFTAFTNPDSQVLLKGESPVREIYSIDIDTEHDGDYRGLISITMKGNGFLYNMVRIIAGTMLAAGTGQLDPDRIPQILESRSRKNAGPTAQARGLILKEIKYTDTPV